MNKVRTHHYKISGNDRVFDNMKDICDHIGIKQPTFKYLLQSGFVKKINNEPANTGEKQTYNETKGI